MAVHTLLASCLVLVLLGVSQAGSYGYHPKPRPRPRVIFSGPGGLCNVKLFRFKIFRCKRGLRCINRRCFSTVGEGSRCGGKTFALCSSGLSCKGGRCRRPRVGPGGACKVTFDCKKGLFCGPRKVGSGNVCIQQQTAGKTCDGVGFQCGKGLRCRKGICRRRRLPVGSPCSTTSQCKSGLTCEAGPSGSKICTDERTEGETCNAAGGLKCASGLICKGGKCRRPLSGKGGRCNTSSDCKSGLRCIRTRTSGKCFVVRGKGQSCGTPFVICGGGLRCKRHVCRRRRKYGY